MIILLAVLILIGFCATIVIGTLCEKPLLRETACSVIIACIVCMAMLVGESMRDASWRTGLVQDHKMKYQIDPQTGKTNIQLLDTTLQKTFKLVK